MALPLVLYLAFVGATMGSFVDALVWRLPTGRPLTWQRSECESCQRTLGVVDLVPVVSWLALRGRCRHCGMRISVLTPLAEASLAGLFVVSALAWPLGFGRPATVASFVLWLIYLVVLAALAVYDARWKRLPDAALLVLGALALVDAGLRVSLHGPLTLGGYAGHALLGAAVLGGAYAVPHLLSRGRWVGAGDVKLAAFVGIVLGWEQGLLAAALANVLAAAVALAGLVTGRLVRGDRLAYGPFLIAGFVMTGLI